MPDDSPLNSLLKSARLLYPLQAPPEIDSLPGEPFGGGAPVVFVGGPPTDEYGDPLPGREGASGCLVVGAPAASVEEWLARDPGRPVPPELSDVELAFREARVREPSPDEVATRESAPVLAEMLARAEDAAAAEESIPRGALRVPADRILKRGS